MMYAQLIRRVRHIVDTPYRLDDDTIARVIEATRHDYVLPEEHRREIVKRVAARLSQTDAMTS